MKKIDDNSTQIKQSVKITRNERVFVSILTLITAVAVLINSILGPLMFDIIQMYTSESGITQTVAQDLINLIIIVPLLIIGAIFNLKRKPAAKFFLILTPVYLMYFGLSYGIGQEWSHPAYTGNIENFFLIYLLSIITGLILIIYTLPQFTPVDAPNFNRTTLKWYTIISTIFITLFALMWLKEIFEVIQNGDLQGNAYTTAPNVFWVIRYLDLGFTIPLGYIGFYLLYTRTKQFYSLLLLFFGFFATMVTAVNTMAWLMWLKNDPTFQTGGLFLFNTLTILVYLGFFYLIRDKLRKK